MSCNIDPFHVDVSALKSFYEEMDILPPVDSYESRFTGVGESREGGKGTWKVKLGDTVAIELERDSKGYSSSAHFPFVVPWAPCEVVTIYRLHKTKGSCARLRERFSKRPDRRGGDAVGGTTSRVAVDGEVMIEIRWLYRQWEIPGAFKKKSESIDGRLAEVFETDQVDACSADSVLSPVILHDATTHPPAPPRSVLGMPLVHYHCSRFWSIHRRSFVPSGSLGNRVSRGRMHSAYKAAFSELGRPSSAGISVSSGNKSWKEEFQAAIQNLSLAEAAQDAQENGMVLSCRETERAQIITFLRKAISGLVQSNSNDGGDEEAIKNVKSSLFIAGPPGTGKVRYYVRMRSNFFMRLTAFYAASLDRISQIDHIRTANGAVQRFAARIQFRIFEWDGTTASVRRVYQIMGGNKRNKKRKAFCGGCRV